MRHYDYLSNLLFFRVQRELQSAVWIVADSGGRTLEHLGAQQCQLRVPRELLVFDDVFKRLRKICYEFVLFVSVRQSVFPHGTPLLSLEEFL